MFVTRNIVERIIPFFLLIFLNFMIIRTLRKETQRFASMDKTASCNERLNKRSLRVSQLIRVFIIILTGCDTYTRCCGVTLFGFAVSPGVYYVLGGLS
jgi:hypothetical protein